MKNLNKLNILIIIIFIIIVIFAVYFVVNSSLKRKNIQYPFFVSTKTALTNIRTGAGKDYPILLSYQAYNVPLKVLEKYNEWYRVENFNGSVGWVISSLVVRKKTAIITKTTNLYINNSLQSKILGIIKDNNIVLINECKQELCKITFVNNTNNNKPINGWILKQHLWGDIN